MLTFSYLAVPMVQGQPTVVGRTQTSITLSFTPSTGRVNTYQVQYYGRRGFSSDYFSGAVIQHSNVPTLQITQDNLQPDTSYQLRIVPYVSTNRGNPSDPVITATLGNCEKEICFNPFLTSNAKIVIYITMVVIAFFNPTQFNKYFIFCLNLKNK